MRIIVAYDGSSAGENAILELRRAGLPLNADALVVSVTEPWPVPVSVDGGDLFAAPPLAGQGDAETLARAGRARLEEEFPSWKVESVGANGSITRELLQRAASWQADLIVVGSRGRSFVGRAALGSISQQVATSAHCSVRLSRPSLHASDLPVRLLLALDGSEDAMSAADEVVRRRWPEHSKVWIVSAVPLLPGSDEAEEAARSLRDLHERVGRELAAVGLHHTSTIVESDPRRAILDEAEEIDADAIFVGARGLTPYERVLLGSVSAAVAARASCSVEIVRDWRARD